MEGARASSAPLKWALLCTFLCLSLDLAHCGVTYNGKSLIIDGRQRILFSGSIHYPRSPPQVLHMFSDFSFFWFLHSSDEMLVLCGHSFLTRVFDVNAENQMWEALIQKAKDGGLDVIDTYVFWNIHEPSPGNVIQASLPPLLSSSLFLWWYAFEAV